MNTTTSRWVWAVVFAASVGFAVITLAQLKGITVFERFQSDSIDQSWVTKAIVAVFVATLILNARNTLQLFHEAHRVRSGLRHDPTMSELRLLGNGLLGLHAARMQRIYGPGFEGEVSQDVSLGVIRSCLTGQEWFVRMGSSLLLTLGLIGTVMGLTQSLQGLSSTVLSVADQSSGNTTDPTSSDGMSAGMNQAIGGMATAFGTTLFGAIMGGVFLKTLSGCTQYLAEELVNEIEITTETQLVPFLRGAGSDLAVRRRETLDFMDLETKKQKEKLDQLIAGMDSVVRHFEKFADVAEQSSTSHPGSLGSQKHQEKKTQLRHETGVPPRDHWTVRGINTAFVGSVAAAIALGIRYFWNAG